LLTGRDPGSSQTVQVNLGRIRWMDVGLLGLRPMALVGLRELSQKRSEISPTIRPRILGSSASNDNVGEPRFVGVWSSNEFVHDRTRQRRAILPRYGEHRLGSWSARLRGSRRNRRLSKDYELKVQTSSTWRPSASCSNGSPRGKTSQTPSWMKASRSRGMKKALALLASDRYLEKGMGLMALTGRRPAEIFFSAKFSLPRKKLPYPAVIFDGQLQNP
jgi:hypothetical protein